MEEIYSSCDFVAQVKEIEPCEYDLLREGQIVFTCIHPAAHPEELDALLEKKVIAFTAEDTHRYGSPNCEAAGKAGAFLGLYAMMSMNGGCGKFVSGLGAAPNVKVGAEREGHGARLRHGRARRDRHALAHGRVGLRRRDEHRPSAGAE